MQFRIKAAIAAAVFAAALAAPSAFAAGTAPHGSHASLKCHGSYEKLAKLTAKPGEKFNPHDSHMGRIECTQCHSMHAKSHYICRDCHSIADRKFKGE